LNSIELFFGKGILIVKSGKINGIVEIAVISVGLKEAKVSIETKQNKKSYKLKPMFSL